MSLLMIPPKRLGLRKRKSANGQEVLNRLKEYLDGCIDGPVKILCGFWADQQLAISYKELRQAVRDGALSAETISQWQQDYSVLVKNKLASMWTEAIAAGPSGQPLLDGVRFKLDMQTSGILSWVNERSAEFVTSSTQEQKEAIAALLGKKMRDNHTVDELARMIRPCIGLTEGQAMANARYYDHIVETLTNEHPRMSKASIRQKALDAASKYAERQHRQRALTIAQTESAFAYNRGADEGVRQAQERNYLGICKKRWSTSRDDAVCKVCASLEGMEIEMDESFNFKGKTLFAGFKMLPPAHPRCACGIEYIEIYPPQTMIMQTTDYLIRDNDLGIDTSAERMVIDDAISAVPAKVKEMLEQGTIIDVGKIGACQYNYIKDILYVAKDADKTSVIHEIGHMVDNKMLDGSKVMDTLIGAVGAVDIMKIRSEIYYDASDNPVEILLVNCPKFISEYQGRIYADTIWDAFDDEGNFRYELMKEYVSEGFREYIENPMNLLTKDPELFLMLSEVVM